MRGFKFHPSLQGFSPDDRRYYPLYEVIEEAGLPAVHTGQTGIGAGLPGGRGIKLRLSNPMLLDDVAADFPGMTVILAHPSVPWQDEAISIATHKANVYIDLSGWSPKYFPPQLVRAASSYLQDKMLFGTDYPLLAHPGTLATRLRAARHQAGSPAQDPQAQRGPPAGARLDREPPPEHPGRPIARAVASTVRMADTCPLDESYERSFNS